MSKTKSLGCAILFGAIALVCLFGQAYGCIFPFLIVGAVFAMIAWYKYQRDRNIATKAHQEQMTSSREMELPPMTSKGSNGRLFVPPSLH